MTGTVSLQSLNTFGIQVQAGRLIPVDSAETLICLIRDGSLNQEPFLILGGGSNVLFTRDFKGTILKNEIGGIHVDRETESHVFLKAGGGVVWDDLVKYAVAKDWGGLENLSLIPGTVGAAPIQNIGAYGVELKDVFDSLEAVDLANGNLRVFTREECRFGYRDSVFKQECKGSYFIVSVTFRLSIEPKIHTGYGDIAQWLTDRGIDNPGISDVREAVCSIRRSKLPDPKVLGNAGSFFKNPVIPSSQYIFLKEKFPEIKSFPAGNNEVKIPAGWLIEHAGWKGYRRGQVGVHERQALVLVNYGGAAGQEILSLARDIMKDVKECYGIDIQPEVNIL